MSSALSPTPTPTLAETLKQRRDRLSKRINFPVVLHSGRPPSRNFPANVYRFRASSHFLYFAGLPLPNAAVYLDGGNLTLFVDEASPAAALWHGPSPSRQELAETIGADDAYPMAELTNYLPNAVSLTHAETAQHQGLIEAIVDLRSRHDPGAIAAIRQAVTVSITAHHAGMAATPGAKTEAQVRAAMEQVIMAADMACAYNSIVTVYGEVLHNEHYHHSIQPG
ncbi:MAG: aminopeptidase P N-terminal domain-containing protein, partial [Cyanobacteria bacterium P01_D01_bin.128]